MGGQSSGRWKRQKEKEEQEILGARSVFSGHLRANKVLLNQVKACQGDKAILVQNWDAAVLESIKSISGSLQLIIARST